MNDYIPLHTSPNTPGAPFEAKDRHGPSSVYRKVRSVVNLRGLLLYQAVMFALLGALFMLDYVEYGAGKGFAPAGSSPDVLAKRWGYSPIPQSYECYKAERSSWLLAVFLGFFGADHWYSHHWILATFKLLTFGGFGLWAIADVILWALGGIYGTPGCPGGYHGPGGN